MQNDPVKKIYDTLDAEMLEEVIVFKKPPQHFRASEAGECGRRIWYRLSAYRPTPDKTFSKLLSMGGNYDHDVIRQLLKHSDAGIDGLVFLADGGIEEPQIVKSFEVDGQKFDIVARADGYILLDAEVVGNSRESVLALLEIKSVDGWTYKHMNDAFVNGGPEGALKYIANARQKYIKQCTVTAKLHSKDWIYLLIRDRSMCQIGLYNAETGARTGGAIWQVDEEEWQRILNKFARISEALKEGKPPRAEYVDGSKECNYCPFYYACHAAKKRKERGITPDVYYPILGIGGDNGEACA